MAKYTKIHINKNEFNAFPNIWLDETFGFTTKEEVAKLPKRYIITKEATILFWSDDKKDKTIVKTSKDDKFDKRIGFLTAYFQKHSGLTKTQANKYLDGLIVDEKKGK